MKKIVLFTAALAMVAVMSKAADDVAVSETEISTTQTAEEPEYKDVNTDQAILESHKPLYHAPAPDAEKDFKYWAAAVGSRLNERADYPRHLQRLCARRLRSYIQQWL